MKDNGFTELNHLVDYRLLTTVMKLFFLILWSLKEDLDTTLATALHKIHFDHCRLTLKH